jgi:membrane protein CcdC involved in cytochrome C biogenesis
MALKIIIIELHLRNNYIFVQKSTQFNILIIELEIISIIYMYIVF